MLNPIAEENSQYTRRKDDLFESPFDYDNILYEKSFVERQIFKMSQYDWKVAKEKDIFY